MLTPAHISTFLALMTPPMPAAPSFIPLMQTMSIISSQPRCSPLHFQVINEIHHLATDVKIQKNTIRNEFHIYIS